MEKFRKFADPIGVNPFVPEPYKIRKRNILLKIIFMFQLLIGLIKSICFVLCYFQMVFNLILKELLFFSFITNLVEQILVFFNGRILLFLLSVYRLPYKYQKVSTNGSPKVIIAAQSSIIDWIILFYLYSPRFLWIVKSQDSTEDYFISLSYTETFTYGLSLNFLTTTNSDLKNRKFDLVEYLNNNSNTQPVVIFPECDKTNRTGVLSIKSNLMNELYDQLNKNKNLICRAENITKQFSYFSPHNTVDESGWSTLLWTCSQFYNSVEIYSQDIANYNFDPSTSYDRSKYKTKEHFFDNTVQELIADPKHRFPLTIGVTIHKDFLEYYYLTSKDSSYVKQNSDYDKIK